MRPILFSWLIATLFGLGCSPHDDPSGPAADAAVRVLLPETTTGRVSWRVVEAPAVAPFLAELATRLEFADELPAAAYAAFAAAGGSPSIAATAAEVVTLPGLAPSQIMVVTDDRDIWVNHARDLRNGRLVMGAAQRGGGVALRRALELPGVREDLTRTARVALADQQFLVANRLAQILDDAALVADVQAVQVEQLIAQARAALVRDDVEQALAFVASADEIVAGHGSVAAVRQLILEDYGGLQQVLEGHAGAVRAVAINPAGTFIASGGDDRVIRLWDVAQGIEVRKLEGHQAVVTGLAFDPSGRTLASCSHDGTVRLWDIATGELRFTSPNLGWKEAAIAFSPDGRWIASGGDDAQVRVWTVSAMWDRRYLRGHGWAITSLAFGPEGRLLVSGSADDTARQWNVTTGGQMATFRQGFSDILSVAVDPAGRRVATGAADGTVRLWSADDQKPLRGWSVAEQPARAVDFTPSGSHLVAGVGELIPVWDVATGQVARLFRSPRGAVNALTVMPGGRQFVTGGEQGAVAIWRFPKKIWPNEVP